LFNTNCPTLAVVGGGLAGLAAAESAVRKGFQAVLFEKSKILGGRCASMFDPKSGQYIDNGQHIALGCNPELSAFHQRLGLDRFFERNPVLPFAHIDGRHWNLESSAFLPTAWRFLPSLFKNPFFTFSEKRQLVKALRHITLPLADGKFSELFWSPIIHSVLSEIPENTAPEALQLVIQRLFFADRHAADIYVPAVPLRTIYHEAAGNALQHLGVELNLLHRLTELTRDEKQWTLRFADGKERQFDYVIFAVPSFRFGQIAESSGWDTAPFGLDRFEPGAITTLHLWFDQPLLPKGQSLSTLLGGDGQFLVVKNNESPFYYTVVISASHRLLADGELTAKGALPLVERVVAQLHQTFFHGKSNVPKLLHYRATTCVDAVFSPSPSVFSSRPSAKTAFPNIALAGDWTATGLPSTMEGAVISGLAAVKQLENARIS
jgi:squalene-associated FAD-dependent desaturase